MGPRLRFFAGPAGFADRSAAQGKIPGARASAAASPGQRGRCAMIRGRHPSGAKARIDLAACSARLKSCPFKTRRADSVMKSRILLALATLLLLSAQAYAQDDLAMRAMKDELARTMSQIQLQKLDKPYFVAYRMDDIDQVEVSAMLGSVTQQQPTRLRLIGVEVRVGDYT